MDRFRFYIKKNKITDKNVDSTLYVKTLKECAWLLFCCSKKCIIKDSKVPIENILLLATIFDFVRIEIPSSLRS